MSEPINRLFVYGTLGPGRTNEHWLRRIGGKFQEAQIRGRLYPEGWGATLGYPAMVIDMEGEVISGHVFTSDNLSNHWPALDDFEGEGYERVLTMVQLQDGENVEAYVYALSLDQRGA